jgi:beta-glucanase (GH16 family)
MRFRLWLPVLVLTLCGIAATRARTPATASGIAAQPQPQQSRPAPQAPQAPQDTAAPAKPPITTSTRQLVWADEFNTPGAPDPAHWTYDTGGDGWGNQELEFYTRNRRENARIEDGHLIIEARREPWEGSAYTSARLVSKGKGDWTYGRVEVRARLPQGRGSWPAIWMLATTPGKLRWPDDGELDIMEHVGFDPGVIHGSAHTRRYNHVMRTQKTGTVTVPDAMRAFHVYAIEWDRDRVRWLVDDREYYTFTNEHTDHGAWPFDGPFHLILNVAVGGAWGGQKGVDDSALPMRMDVDYVRIYQ